MLTAASSVTLQHSRISIGLSPALSKSQSFQRPKGLSDVHSRRQEHQGHLPGPHRQDRHLPHRAGARLLRHQDGRRHHSRQGRRDWTASCGTLPIFDTVAEAQGERPAPTPRSIYVPPAGAADAILEAIDAEIPLIVCITEGIPVLDMVKVKRALDRLEVAADRAELPGRADAGRVQDRHHARATSSARARSALSRARARLPTRRCSRPRNAGPRPDHRRRHRRRSGQGHRVHRRARNVPRRRRDTKSIIMIGEIGGSAEEDAAQFLNDEAKRGRKKPMAGFIAGRTAPPGRTHGPCRRHHLRRQGRRGGQDRGDGGGRHPRVAVAGPARHDAGRVLFKG